MLRSRSTLAVLFSITLVISAVWVRHAKAKDQAEIEAGLIAENAKRSEEYSKISKELLSASNLVLNDSKTLSNTDLIGRQLFNEYMALSSQGRATPENLNELAAKYAENVIALDDTDYIGPSEIITSDDTEENLQQYGNTMFSIKAKYGSKIKSAMNSTPNITPGNPDFINFMKNVSIFYKEASEEIRRTPVPLILKDNHLRLVNLYLSTSNAAEIISKIDTDPLGAYSAINTQAKNSSEETDLYLYIESTMRLNGLALNSNT